jgi:hypothetical protein
LKSNIEISIFDGPWRERPRAVKVAIGRHASFTHAALADAPPALYS